MERSDIKLFVACHQPLEVPNDPLLVPIQVGTVLADKRFEGFLHDDLGENISDRNRSYCELTAQYWAWKNIEAEYYGFFHYRRYLYPETAAKRPYRIEKAAGREALRKLGYDGFASLIGKYDLVAPIGEDMHISVREHYAAAPYHHRCDLELAEQILKELHPGMKDAAERYLSGSVCYFGNIYIMKRNVFHDYCGWLFPILEEYDRRADKNGYSAQELRVDGYLAERLFGIWLTAKRKDLKIMELPRVHFVPDPGERRKKKLLNILLPPGSKRRATVKRLGK